MTVSPMARLVMAAVVVQSAAGVSKLLAPAGAQTAAALHTAAVGAESVPRSLDTL